MDKIQLHTLSSYYGKGWKDLINDKDKKPSIDFAHSDKFEVNEEFYNKSKYLYEKYKHTAQMGKRSFTIRNIEEIYEYFKYESGIEKYLSEITGIDLLLHPMYSEACMYNLTPDITKQENIDNWHYDYVPFVFVYVIEKSDNESGQLVINTNEELQYINLNIGEGIFMQGSQIKHLASRCKTGERTTLVLSFIHKDITIVDNTYITKETNPYHFNENLYYQYIKYKEDRIYKLMLSLSREKKDLDRCKL